MVKFEDLLSVLKEQIKETREISGLLRESMEKNKELNESLGEKFEQKLGELIVQGRSQALSNIGASKEQVKRTKELEGSIGSIIQKDIESHDKLSNDLCGKFDELIYSLDSDKDHEFLTLTAGTTERVVRFNKPVRHIIINTTANVWVDFDRKAQANVSRQILTDEELSLDLWVKRVSAVTTAGTASIRIVGLR